MSASENNPEPAPQPVKDAAPVPTSLPLTDTEVWWEVMAVLAIGVLPPLTSAIVAANVPVKPPYWLHSLSLCLHSAGVSFAVLYVISRSGEPWSSFGLAHPKPRDLVFGLLLALIGWALWERFGPLLDDYAADANTFFFWPQSGADYAWMVVRQAANGFAEELVVRAYLITRLTRLMKSPALAVLFSTLAFASYHLHYGPGGLALVALMGLAYGGIYLLIRRVWPFALGHMLFNMFLECQNSLA
jgi:membrane protease YdiL (CAAX protease family)